MSKPYRMQRIGILNHEGGIWSPETFDSNEAAQAYIDGVAKRWGSLDLSKHKPAPVRVTLSVVKHKPVVTEHPSGDRS